MLKQKQKLIGSQITYIDHRNVKYHKQSIFKQYVVMKNDNGILNIVNNV